MALTEERMNEIIMEETVRNRRKVPDETDEEREFRRGVRKDVRKLVRAGVQVRIPNVEPDLTEG